ncbi:solute carrier family 2, facilitated glucose transporter member 11 [Physeter macrocephalus]|uniref:Solute carrier family 2, facilitated glucose transporter member 11 n=1 Tax=Physeter macrocephalus TaxID=9755 RepID=A0A455AVT5_PHYMC|nr:solute carrier family 2, facilitated glucose transporter member 11 [Physeter catodon]|eukprot:XP_028335966.1 solute carrier family 2, facilitated glucose transporter member 11 [Physeter catodon]
MGHRARSSKESVTFHLQSCRKGGMEDEHEPPLQPRTQFQGRVLLLTICAAGIGGTFQFGYNLSIINAPTSHIQEFTNETWRTRTGRPLPDHLVPLMWSLIVSLYPVGGLLGALLAGPLAITLGRKKSLLVNNIFVVAAATLFGFSRRAGSFEMIMLGRLLVGVSAGVSMNVQPMYLGESAPKELRGSVAMTSAIFTALGIVMGQVVGLRELLGGPQAWPLLLASCLVPGVLQLASLPLLPESPRYLLIDCGDSEACLAALQRLRGPADLAGELAELERERAACQGRRARRPWELFRDRALRRQVASLVVLGGAVELCGNDAVSSPRQAGVGRRGEVEGGGAGSGREPGRLGLSPLPPSPWQVYAYASAVFSQARIPPEKVQYASIGTGGCELLAALLSCVVIERVGRRILLIGGYGLMTCWGSVFTAALCLQSSLPWMPYLAMSCVFAFILSFGIGPAGVTGILATELFDQMARPAAYMVCGALMWTMLFLVGLGFPFIMEGLSHLLYVPFLCVCVCGAVYTGFFLPETRGKSFVDISEELHRLNFPGVEPGPRVDGPEVIWSTEL